MAAFYPMAFDVVLRGGSVIDGTGASATTADVGITGDRITAMGDLSAADATTVIDATDRVVTPGFVDTHTHTDTVPFLADDHEVIKRASLVQGVTTEVCGNCGWTPFPCLPEHEPTFRHNWPDHFRSLADFRTGVEDRGTAVNLAPLIGHGYLRGGTMGFDDRAATDDELRRMESELDRAFDEGAFGLSSGLIYAPGMYGSTEELIALARVVGRHSRLYTTHMRNESNGVLGAMQEALRIGREGGCGVHISHHKVSGTPNWGRSRETLALLDEARAAGEDVTIDVYPYTAGSTTLLVVLPDWANAGGPDAAVARLRDPDERRRVLDAMGGAGSEDGDIARDTGWTGIVIASAANAHDTEGLSIAELAEREGKAPAEAACDLLVRAGGRAQIVLHSMHADDVAAIRAWPLAMIGSDGLPFPGRQHPRVAGTFAKVVGEAARAGTLAEQVHRITGMPADRFRLRDRGVIREGAIADLVVFDPATVTDRATYDDPWLTPIGVDHVLVGGAFGVRDGTPTGARAGRVLDPA
jgi:dihydroorotase/N-acyl-D-amino-acid deacylase